MSEIMPDDSADGALLSLARELIDDIAAVRLLELSGGQPGMVDSSGVFHPAPPPPAQPPPGPVSADRLRDPSGQWQPPPPGPGSGWHHTLRHPGNRAHLLGSDDFMQELYGRSGGPGRNAAAGALPGAQSAQDSPQGDSPVPDSELDARGLYKAARGQGAVGSDIEMQRPQLPEASPARPARQLGRSRRTRWR